MDEYYNNRSQPYFCALYKAIASTGYCGMLRIGEMTSGDHPINVRDVFVGRNNKKILIILRTSKTHSIADNPQQVKIADQEEDNNIFSKSIRHCLFHLLKTYYEIRKHTGDKKGPLFISSDRSPVKPENFRFALKSAIKRCGLDPNNYDTHFLRSGRSVDLLKDGTPVENIKQLGGWKSNAVYDYLVETR